jgi:hypothetical protein
MDMLPNRECNDVDRASYISFYVAHLTITDSVAGILLGLLLSGTSGLGATRCFGCRISRLHAAPSHLSWSDDGPLRARQVYIGDQFTAVQRRIMELHYLVSVESLLTRIQQGLGVAKSLAQH